MCLADRHLLFKCREVSVDGYAAEIVNERKVF